MPAARQFKIKLIKCRILDGHLVPDKNATPELLNWNQLRERVVPSDERAEVRKLKLLKAGYFVGTIRTRRPRRHKTPFINFIFAPQGQNKSNIHALLKADPQWAERLQEVYRVEAVDFGAEYRDMGEDLGKTLKRQYPGSLERVTELRQQRDIQMRTGA